MPPGSHPTHRANAPMKLTLFVVVTALCLSSALAISKSISETIDSRPEFSVLAEALKKVRVRSKKGASGFTLFAPTNNAFSDLLRTLGHKGTLTEGVPLLFKFLEHPDSPPIDELISYHVVVPAFSSKTVVGKDLTTLSKGKTFQVAPDLTIKDEAPLLKDPKIIKSLIDIKAKNGFIHGIDAVLFNVPVDPVKAKALFANIQKDAHRSPHGAKSGTSQSATDHSSGHSPGESPEASGEPHSKGGHSDHDHSGHDHSKDGHSKGSRSSSEAGNSPSVTEGPEPSPEICFPASAIVHASDGTNMVMRDLVAGHKVRVSETGESSAVIHFSYRQREGLYTFVRVTTVSGRSVTLSPSHYLHANGRLVAARAVKVGSMLRTVEGPSAVKSVEMVKDFGLFAPHTMHGDILVNGIVASTYTTTVHPKIAHLLLAPVRLLVRMRVAKEPLGSLMYGGSGSWTRLVPGGPEIF